AHQLCPMRNPATPVPPHRTKTMTCNTMQTWLSSPETTAVRTARLGRRTIKMKVFARSAARLV
ncbi:MAG: hypothetical protein WBG13_00005, partial [Pseudolabrys sp.]